MEVQKAYELRPGWNYYRKMKLYCDSRGRVLASLGPHWCGPVVTFFVVIFVCMLNIVIIQRSTCTNDQKDFLTYVAYIFCFVGEILMILTSLADSGTLIPLGEDEEKASLVSPDRYSNAPFCDSCLLYQINKAAHCTFCDCCVEELDHHCPWMGKCIGKGNMFWFKCFIGNVIIFLIQFAIIGIHFA